MSNAPTNNKGNAPANGRLTVLPPAGNGKPYEDIAWFTARGLTTGVYSIRNKRDGKQYIGSDGVHFLRRWECHLNVLRKGSHQNRHLQSAWNKDREDNFVFEIVCPCAPEECIEMEQYFMDFFRAAGGSGYNFLPVAGKTWLGGRHTNEAKAKLRVAQLGRRHGPEAKAKMRAAKLGRKLNPEHKAKVVAALKRRVITEETLRKRSVAMTGQKRTLEQRARIGAAKRNPPQETRDKMRASAIAAHQRKRANAKT